MIVLNMTPRFKHLVLEQSSSCAAERASGTLSGTGGQDSGTDGGIPEVTESTERRAFIIMYTYNYNSGTIRERRGSKATLQTAKHFSVESMRPRGINPQEFWYRKKHLEALIRPS